MSIYHGPQRRKRWAAGENATAEELCSVVSLPDIHALHTHEP